MIKKSWPYIGSTDSEMGNSFVDTIVDSNSYDTFVADGKSTMPEYEPTSIYGYEGGKLSPVDNLDWERYWDSDSFKKMEPRTSSLRLLSLLEHGDVVLDVGCGDGSHAGFMVERGFSVVGIDKSKIALQSNKDEFVKIHGDIRYYNFDRKFDGFQALSCLEHIPDYNLALKNIYNQLRPDAYGLIHIQSGIVDEDEFEAAIIESGFDIVKRSKFHLNIKEEDVPHVEFVVRKFESDKIAMVEIHSNFPENVCPVTRKIVKDSLEKIQFEHNGRKYSFSSQECFDKFVESPNLYIGQKVSFLCDLAICNREKASGLQSYPQLKYGSGLLFPYSVPTDVVYHMGTVRYPIDIIFIDAEDRIKRIYKNIQPGSPAVFGASGIKNVLEICGGLSDNLGISIGRLVNINIGVDTAKCSRVRKILANSLDGGKVFVKSSPIYNDRFYKYKGASIFSISDNNVIMKNSSEKIFLGMLDSNDVLNDAIHIFNLEELLSGKDSHFKLFNKVSGVARDIVVSEVLYNKDILNSYSLRKGPGGSYNNFISSNGLLDKNSKVYLDEIIRLSRDKKNIVVIATKTNGSFDRVKEVLINKIEDYYGIRRFCCNIDILYVNDRFSSKDILKVAHQRYLTNNIKLYSSDTPKMASIDGSRDYKKVAEDCANKFEKAIEKLKDLSKNLDHNKKEYEKIQGDQALAGKTKGKYRESSKKNKEIIENALRSILAGIRGMSDIKDVATTMELVDNVAGTSKACADEVQKVFDLVENVEDVDFTSLIFAATAAAINTINDVLKALDRIRNYIFKDIIGIIPISGVGA